METEGMEAALAALTSGVRGQGDPAGRADEAGLGPSP